MSSWASAGELRDCPVCEIVHLTMNRAVLARVLSVLFIAGAAIAFSVQAACSSGGAGSLDGYGYGK